MALFLSMRERERVIITNGNATYQFELTQIAEKHFYVDYTFSCISENLPPVEIVSGSINARSHIKVLNKVVLISYVKDQSSDMHAMFAFTAPIKINIVREAVAKRKEHSKNRHFRDVLNLP